MFETRAAVLREIGAPLSVETVVFDDPTDHEVVVDVAAAALCHSDLISFTSSRTTVPMIAGHEAAGVVTAVGAGVAGLAPGDRVLFTYIPSCGRCVPCTRGRTVDCVRGMGSDGVPLQGSLRARTAEGEGVRQMTRLGVFSERVVVHEDSCVPVPADTDLQAAALLSCGFMTGAGAAMNAAGTQVGDTVVVIGTGGVGTAAVQGAVAAGAGRIVAVDIAAHKLDAVRKFGATDTLDATQEDWASAVLDLTGGYGADRALLCVGNATADQVNDTVKAIRSGGTAVLVGASLGVPALAVSPFEFTSRHKTLKGSLYGGDDPSRDQLAFLDLHRAGRLRLKEMVTSVYPLAEVNQAIDDLRAGRNIRGMIEFSQL
ncbi:zinc-binding dehydrogenase [Pseudonocardia pini]|uniref:zinc-binding dehydrogenase n=1 Tax=Pseudonocardia pini TaxID=2758030 RepID=UPI0015F05D71|nr:zinc-binding dehydrogenase [Pseudonocardia pini]